MVFAVGYPDLFSYRWVGMAAQKNEPRILKTSSIFFVLLYSI